MISRFYYTLRELVNGISSEYIPMYINYDDENLYGFYEMMSYLNPSLDPEDYNDDKYSKELMKRIWLNMSEKYVLAIDIQHPRWVDPVPPIPGTSTWLPDSQYEVNKLVQSFLSIYEDTRERYVTLIKLYENELDNLLNPIETNSETRFNDVPENAETTPGQYANDNYSTTVTKSSASTDGTSKMNRINEIQNMLRDLYADWAFEFSKLVLGE